LAAKIPDNKFNPICTVAETDDGGIPCEEKCQLELITARLIVNLAVIHTLYLPAFLNSPRLTSSVVRSGGFEIQLYV
jgi:hypothetical protein